MNKRTGPARPKISEVFAFLLEPEWSESIEAGLTGKLWFECRDKILESIHKEEEELKIEKEKAVRNKEKQERRRNCKVASAVLKTYSTFKRMSTIGKTPIEFLHEVCTKKGISPVYELIETEGKVHSPLFHFRCTAGEASAHGQGKTKKLAKHEAAQEVVKLMFCQNGAGDNKGVPMPSLNKEGMAGNPIGQLQELTQKNKWAPPNYSYLENSTTDAPYPGNRHAKEFKCVCSLGKQFEQQAGGRSKKTAKRNAAAAMLQFLKQSAGITTEEMDKDALDGIAAHMDSLNIDQSASYPTLNQDGVNSTVPTINQQASKQIRQFYNKMKSSTGQWLVQLHTAPLNKQGLNYCQFLQQIAEEQRFEVTYVDIHEPTVSGLPQCLVQLSTMPVAVCHGTGTTPDNAHAHAALNALEYLKIMTKKA